MSDNNYDRYIELLREVRSPIGRSEVERLLAHPRQRHFILPGIIAVFVATLLVATLRLVPVGYESAVVKANATSYHVQHTLAFADLRDESELIRPDGHVHPGRVKTRISEFNTVTHAPAGADAYNLGAHPASENGHDGLETIDRVAPAAPDLLMTPRIAASPTIYAVTVSSAEAPVRDILVSLRTSIAGGSMSMASVEYPVSDHLFVGLTSGVESRTITGSIAEVRFRDTTIESNGQSYTSRIGELVPTRSRVYDVVSGASVRWMLNRDDEPWSASFVTSAEYAHGAVLWSAGVAGSLHVIANCSASVLAGYRSTRSAMLSIGLETRW